jgi:hypothetical protein
MNLEISLNQVSFTFLRKKKIKKIKKEMKSKHKTGQESNKSKQQPSKRDKPTDTGADQKKNANSKLASEIDDIFSTGSKKRAAESDPAPPASQSTTAESKNDKLAESKDTNKPKKLKTSDNPESAVKDAISKETKNSKAEKSESGAASAASSSKTPAKAVETVDFSSSKVGAKQQPPPPPDDDGFGDSRGLKAQSNEFQKKGGWRSQLC